MKKRSLVSHEGWLKKIDRVIFGNGQAGLLEHVTVLRVQNKFILGGMVFNIALSLKLIFFSGS